MNLVETTVNGKWVKVPALSYKGKSIITKGTWLRLAQLLDEEWLDSELEDPEACAQLLKSQKQEGLGADLLTFTQKLPGIAPKYDCHMEWDSIAAVQTTSFGEWWEGLPRQTRSNVKRSEKRGVRVLVKPLTDELIQGIMSVNNECPVRQGKPNIHYRKTFEEVKKDHSSFSGKSQYICAYAGDELVGFIWLVHRGNIASILQMLTKESHRDKRPANALVARAVKLCEEKGFLYLTYGMFNYGNKKGSSLTEFKKRNGFGETLVPRFYIPLTSWGKLCMKVRLHRGPLGILPRDLILAACHVRSMFYDLVHSIAPAAISRYLFLRRRRGASIRLRESGELECENAAGEAI